MKIIILDGYTENPGDLSWDGFSALGDLTVYDRTPPEAVAECIGDAQIVLTNKTPVTRETLERCPGVRYIGVLATGYNIVDIDAARERGIAVSNIPAYGTAAVAQFVFALMLELCHHVGEHSRAVAAGEWERCPDFCFWNYPLIELAGKTLGLVGCGRIGRAVAGIGRAFGMEVIGYDKFPAESLDLTYVSLEEVYRRSDFISLHCPLLADNRGMINDESIGKMKDGVYLINTSRGPLVDEAALRRALDSGKVAGAGLDVVETEPIRGGNPLLGAKNCLITPHIAWAAKSSRQRLMDIAVENLSAFLEGCPVNQVNA